MINSNQKYLMQRAVDLELEQAQLVRGLGRAQEGNPLTTSDGEYTFSDIEDLTYYERLTGHIEEVTYLIKAFA